MYAWEVFVSYPRASTKIRNWVEQVFHPQLQEELGALGVNETLVFRDTQDLTYGDWPVHLSEAHRRSKVFIPVLCAPYFKSGWCMAEWSLAFERELVVWGSAHSNELVIPVLFNDGAPKDLDALPEPIKSQVQARTRLPLHEFSDILDRRANSGEALDFRRTVRRLCEERVEPALRNAPTWQTGWPSLPTQPVAGSDPAWFPELPR